MFLAFCCLLIASLTFSAISGITLLILLVLGMILIGKKIKKTMKFFDFS
jgi:hypothetical protein